MLAVLLGIAISCPSLAGLQESVLLRLRPANGTSYSTETTISISNSSGRILYAKIDHDIRVKVLPNGSLRFSETVSKVDINSTGDYVKHNESFQSLQGMEFEVIRNIFCDTISATYRGMKWNGFLFDAFMELHFPVNPVRIGEQWSFLSKGSSQAAPFRESQLMVYQLKTITSDTVTFELSLESRSFFRLHNCQCVVDRRTGLIRSFDGELRESGLGEIFGNSTGQSASFNVVRKISGETPYSR